METITEVAAKSKCFVISTIGEVGSEERDASDLVLEYLIKPAIGDKYEVSRADEESNPGAITPQIVESILEADLVIADLSSYNPNVYYEVAIAHGYERPTVHLQVSGEKPAFDLKDMRLVPYDVTNPRALASAVSTLRKLAIYASENPTKAQTPLSGAKRFLQIEESDDPIAQSNLEIVEQVRRLRSEVRLALQPAPIASRSADIRSMRTVIERVNQRGAIEETDLIDTITQATSVGFDRWIRRIATKVTGVNDGSVVSELLFDAEVLANSTSADDSDD